MDFWQLLPYLVGAGGIIAIIAAVTHYAGLSEYIVQFLNAIWQVILKIVDFVVNNLPKPIRLVLFLILFVLFAGVIYNYSVGAQYVCLDKDVYKVGITEGLAAKMFPQNYFQQKNETVPNIEDEIPVDDAIRLVGYDGNITDFICTPGSACELMFKDYDIDVGTRTFNSITYVVASSGDVVSKLGVNDKLAMNEVDLFENWFGITGNHVTYDICVDKKTNTCTLQRQTKGVLFKQAIQGTPSIASYLSGWSPTVNEDGCGSLFLRGAYGGSAGSITYSLVDNELIGSYSASFIGGGGYLSTDTCQEISDADAAAAINDSPIYGQFFATGTEVGENPKKIVLRNRLTHWYQFPGGPDEITVPLYGVKYAAVMFDEKTVNNSLIDKRIQAPGHESKYPTATARDLFDHPTKVTDGALSGTVTFACADTTDPTNLKTKMKVIGIDIFSTTFMAFALVLGGLFWALGFIMRR